MGSSSRTTVAVVTAAVLGLALIGALIWAFTLKSQRDDARADAARAKTALASAGKAAASEAQNADVTERRLRGATDAERHRYVAVRRRLGVASTQESDLENRVDERAQALRQADRSVTNATDADDRADAQLKRSKAQSAVAVACAQGFLSTLDEFYGPHPDSQHAADHVLDRLERLQPRCVKAVGQAQ